MPGPPGCGLMALFPGSRHTFCRAVRDAHGRLYLTDREPYLYEPHADNRVHTVAAGDSLFGLAGQYFTPLPRASGFWWAIADFQPNGPIIDPTLDLVAEYAQIVVPSLR